MKPFVHFILVIAISLGVVPNSDAGIFKRPKRTPELIERSLDVAEKDRVRAIEMLENYAKSGQDKKLATLARLHAGEHYRLSGDFERAKAHFVWLKEKHPQSDAREGALLGLAILALRDSESGNAIATLKLIQESRAPRSMNAERYRILAIAASNGNDSNAKDALYFAEKAVEFANGDQKKKIRLELSVYFPEAEFVPKPTEAPNTDPPDLRALKDIRHALHSGNLSETKLKIDAFETNFSDSPFIAKMEWMRKKAEAGNPINLKKVGVMLPLTGQLGPAGKMIRAGIEQAFLDRESDVELVFFDTEGTQENSIKGMETLVLDEGVSLVIGPLLKEVTLAVADIAQQAEIPMITLSQFTGITERGEWIFRGSMTKTQQIESLLSHVMGTMALQTFATIAPDNDFGRDAAAQFEAQVVAQGGSVHMTVFYDPTKADYRETARILAQTTPEFMEERKDELYALYKAAKERGLSTRKVKLPPIIEFDAIFVPDKASRVIMVASALAYEEFSIGHFRARRDDTPLPLIGLNGWNDPRLSQQGGPYFRDSVFVDAFSKNDHSNTNQQFVRNFTQKQGRSPGVFEAIAYDVGHIVDVALSVEHTNREDVRDALLGVHLSSPITGGKQFAENREWKRDLSIMTVRKNGIEFWDEQRNIEPTPIDEIECTEGQEEVECAKKQEEVDDAEEQEEVEQ